MSRIGQGYGSEYRLKCYLEDYPNTLAQALHSTGMTGPVEWLPRVPAVTKPEQLVELKGLSFLGRPEIEEEWRSLWPHGRGIHNWDAVGWLYHEADREPILVEAKANIYELHSSCQARRPDSLERIANCLDATKLALGVPPEANWLAPYYQFCNRLAVLWFLHQHGITAHLLSIYFTQDRPRNGEKWPQTADDWYEPLRQQTMRVGLSREHSLASYIHTLFLPAEPTAAG